MTIFSVKKNCQMDKDEELWILWSGGLCFAYYCFKWASWYIIYFLTLAIFRQCARKYLVSWFIYLNWFLAILFSFFFCWCRSNNSIMRFKAFQRDHIFRKEEVSEGCHQIKREDSHYNNLYLILSHNLSGANFLSTTIQYTAAFVFITLMASYYILLSIFLNFFYFIFICI